MSHKLVAKLLLWCFYFLCVSLKLGLSNNKCLYYNYLITTCTKVYNKVQEKSSRRYNFAFVNKKTFTPLEVIFVQWNLDDLKSVWLAKQKIDDRTVFIFGSILFSWCLQCIPSCIILMRNQRHDSNRGPCIISYCFQWMLHDIAFWVETIPKKESSAF